METLLLKPDAEGIAAAAELLRNGKLVAFPTETVYGLGANGFDGSAVRDIYAAKGRPSDNPLILHAAELEMALTLTSSHGLALDRFRILAHAFWPGPLTIVAPASPLIPREVTAGLDTVAIRMPSHPAARALISACGLPLAAPSANISGSPSPTTAAHVMNDLAGRIPAVLDGGACEVGVESTIVSVFGSAPVLLRPGGISLAELVLALDENVSVDEAVTGKIDASRRVRAPGMKYRHYAPKLPVTAVTGDGNAEYIASQRAENTCVLCFDEYAARFAALGFAVVPYGGENDTSEQARRLFDALRRLDGTGCAAAFAQLTSRTDGAAAAVVNRLSKAAGFNIVHCETARNSTKE